eukprot:gene6044-1080_t
MCPNVLTGTETYLCGLPRSPTPPNQTKGCDLGTGSDDCATCTADAELSALVEAVNDYRQSVGLARVPYSPSLQTTAELHVQDMVANYASLPDECNLHSWSGASSQWTYCCYTSDHAQAECMWSKPREVSEYTGNGYEISYATSGKATTAGALSAWQTSSGHHDVILNRGIWDKEWKGMGAAMSGGYAVVWFGHAKDPVPSPIVC